MEEEDEEGEKQKTKKKKKKKNKNKRNLKTAKKFYNTFISWYPFVSFKKTAESCV
jgi:hypothetical protein